ncbi:hypothetical protein CRYUN_Cryun15aG0119100 [Craigia yunnanensis]
MDSILHSESLSLTRLCATSTSTASIHHMPCQLLFRPEHRLFSPLSTVITSSDSRRKEDLHVVKPTTTVDEALEALVEHRITSFPVIDDDWKLNFNEVQKLLNKTNGQVVGDLMTPAPVIVRETTNVEDAAIGRYHHKRRCRKSCPSVQIKRDSE